MLTRGSADSLSRIRVSLTLWLWRCNDGGCCRFLASWSAEMVLFRLRSGGRWWISSAAAARCGNGGLECKNGGEVGSEKMKIAVAVDARVVQVLDLLFSGDVVAANDVVAEGCCWRAFRRCRREWRWWSCCCSGGYGCVKVTTVAAAWRSGALQMQCGCSRGNGRHHWCRLDVEAAAEMVRTWSENKLTEMASLDARCRYSGGVAMLFPAWTKRCGGVDRGCRDWCVSFFSGEIIGDDGDDGAAAAVVDSIVQGWWWCSEQDGGWRWCNCGGRQDWRRRLPWRVVMVAEIRVRISWVRWRRWWRGKIWLVNLVSGKLWHVSAYGWPDLKGGDCHMA